MKFYTVGGCIRDEIIGRNSNDIDYSVEGSYDELYEYLIDNDYKILLEKKEFLTIKAKKNNKTVDFVICRKDGFYSDYRHPDNVKLGTIYNDLSRRDFTMNAIAKDVNNNYIDPYFGKLDIKNKLIRCVGNIDRLKEDSLRMIRALRFHIILNFKLHDDIIKALHDDEYVNLLHFINENRICYELTKCFAYNTYKTLYTLNQYPKICKIIFEKIKLRPFI